MLLILKHNFCFHVNKRFGTVIHHISVEVANADTDLAKADTTWPKQTPTWPKRTPTWPKRTPTWPNQTPAAAEKSVCKAEMANQLETSEVSVVTDTLMQGSNGLLLA